MQLALLFGHRKPDTIPPATQPPLPLSGASSLRSRLIALGLPPEMPVAVTRNRSIMLSWRPRTGLRLHAGFAAASDDVLQAIVRYLARRTSRAERQAARRVFMAFPVHEHAPSHPRRTPRIRPVAVADQPLVDRLVQTHAALNAEHFAGALGPVPIRLSDRMRRRLGELRAPHDGAPLMILISRRHIRRDGWLAALDTLLHEMVHQWQAETGRPIDHGREFRATARRVGIEPRAVADLTGRK